MTNNEKFNAMLNSCQNPRAMYAVLGAIRVDEQQAKIDELEKLVEQLTKQ